VILCAIYVSGGVWSIHTHRKSWEKVLLEVAVASGQSKRTENHGEKDCDKWQWRLVNPNAPKIM
jgi:hypothetical protein